MQTKAQNNFKPILHFSPKKNWLNDPNGLIYFKGEYHLFFQHNPNETVWGPMHWGHAVSKDLITWEELDIALWPDELGTIFSGSAVVDWDNTTGFFPDEPGLVAIFTHHLDRENKPPLQTQSLAYSHDRGRTWTKYEGNPVLKHPTKIDFRDPKVFWHKQSKKWVMSLATGQSISFYSSLDLLDWEFESEFGEGIGCHDGVWECPDLFELPVEGSDEKKWVLIVSIGDNDKFDFGSRTQYFIGTFDGSKFVPDDESIKWLDFGKDNYAGVSFSDIPKEDGRRIYVGWMSNWRYANQLPTIGWRNQMTLPRTLVVQKQNDSMTVIQKTVQELDLYFKRAMAFENEIIKETFEKDLDENQSALEIVANIKNLDSKQFGVVINHTDDQYTEIIIEPENKLMTLSREKSGIIDFSENFKNDQLVELDDIDHINLRIIIDRSSIEVFVNDGFYALTSLIYPDQIGNNISFFAKGGEIKLENGYVATSRK